VRFNEYADAIRSADPDLTLIASGVAPDQYGLGGSGIWDDWNSTLLAEAGHHIDVLSLHWYFPGVIGRRLRDDDADYLQVATGADDLERILSQIAADLGRLDRPAPSIALDEWGQMAALEDHLDVNHRLADAPFFAGCQNAMIRHAGSLSMAMIAGLVNVLAPIQTVGPRHFGTSAYLVGLLYRQHGGTHALTTSTECGRLQVPAMADLERAMMMSSMARVERTAAVLDTSAVAGDAGVTVFITNRSPDRATRVRVSGVPDAASASFRSIVGPDLFARNTVDRPTTLGFATSSVSVDGREVVVEVPPATVGALIVDTVPR
jgi:alpha-N-arabinofuranosidase